MFDVGFWELLVIAVVLLLVMGPERLPEVAKQAAFLLRKARQSMYKIRNEMKSEIDGSPLAGLEEARREMADFKNDIKQMGRDLADSHEKVLNEEVIESSADSEPSVSDEPSVNQKPLAMKQPSSKKAASSETAPVKKKTIKKAKKKTSKKRSSKKVATKTTSGDS